MHTLMVTNVPLTFGDSQFHKLFAAYGSVDRVVRARPPGGGEGYAFVDMTDSREATAARKGLHGRQVDGRMLTVESVFQSFG